MADPATVLLTIGPPHTLTQNIVYALPARKCRIHATAAVQISVDGSAWDALTGAEGVGAEVASVFIKTVSTTAPAIVTLRV